MKDENKVVRTLVAPGPYEVSYDDDELHDSYILIFRVYEDFIIKKDKRPKRIRKKFMYTEDVVKRNWPTRTFVIDNYIAKDSFEPHFPQQEISPKEIVITKSADWQKYANDPNFEIKVYNNILQYKKEMAQYFIEWKHIYPEGQKNQSDLEIWDKVVHGHPDQFQDKDDVFAEVEQRLNETFEEILENAPETDPDPRPPKKRLTEDEIYEIEQKIFKMNMVVEGYKRKLLNPDAPDGSVCYL